MGGRRVSQAVSADERHDVIAGLRGLIMFPSRGWDRKDSASKVQRVHVHGQATPKINLTSSYNMMLGSQQLHTQLCCALVTYQRG